ncbi:serine acetyltransferase [Rhizobium sp. AQ_MP]|uniref:serine acetyltransferase n=1 Tax=Rhizobium sp. AQ_MP TaxID=2761536 RepID=UPI00163A2F33|nr:DapH/DapD/GlmU-related protein [Rhizobium sp. AQ_MP]MBC2775872.1 serine acetyltransferase [Rhizobium sp. AQ_MP]
MRAKQIFERDLNNQVPPVRGWNYLISMKYPILTWQRRLRSIEELQSSKKLSAFRKIKLAILKYKHKKDSVRLGFTIPPHTFGPGLSIAHWGTIAVEGEARIGANCRIHQGVTIGRGKGKNPKIGDNCFIGANACVIGDVTLGDNVRIGAGAVVVHSFGDGAVLVGNPARDVSKTEVADVGGKVE